MSEMVLESDGRCFLCLDQIQVLSQLPPGVIIKQEEPESGPQEEGEGRDLSSYGGGTVPSAYRGGGGGHVNSLQSLSRYLRTDLRKVFENGHRKMKEGDVLKLLRSKLEVELCGECAPVMERFSGLYRQLEKIEMEVGSLVELIKGKMSRVTEELGGGGGELKMLEVLRVETLANCSKKLLSAAPRINLRPIDMVERPTSLPDGVTRSDFLSMSDVDMENSEFPPHFPSDDIDIDLDVKYEPEDCGPLIPSNRKEPKNPLQLPYSILAHSGHYQCALCPFSCPRYDSFRQHHNATHLQMRLRCVDCGKEFQHRGNYYRHRQRMHEKVRVKCDVCHRSFAKGYIDDHRRETHGKEKVGAGSKKKNYDPDIKKRTCHICGNEYKHSSSLRNHLRKDH